MYLYIGMVGKAVTTFETRSITKNRPSVPLPSKAVYKLNCSTTRLLPSLVVQKKKTYNVSRKLLRRFKLPVRELGDGGGFKSAIKISPAESFGSST